MKKTNFRDFLEEETVSGDIETVDSNLGMSKRNKHLSKGKKCKKHKRANCVSCEEERYEDYN